jgi:hypothetical protein
MVTKILLLVSKKVEKIAPKKKKAIGVVKSVDR